MKNFNERYKKQVDSWKEKYATATENMKAFDKNNLLIAVDYESEVSESLLSKIQMAIDLYKKEKRAGKNVKLIFPVVEGFDYNLLIENNFVDSSEFYVVEKIPEVDDDFNREVYAKSVAEFAKGIAGETYGTVYQISNPKEMYSNLLDYVENGIVPLNFSAPVRGEIVNIFDVVSTELLQKIAGTDFNWFMANHADKSDEWQARFRLAEKTMCEATVPVQGEKRKVLIECAAQHPLDLGVYPGSEFKARLDKAAELYFEEKHKGNIAKIYIPGSLHQIFVQEDGEKVLKRDIVSLSKSGEMYLRSCGIPAEDIYGEKLNNELMPKGVYNSGDECRVASEIFKSKGFNELLSVTSPGQLYRVALFYANFGVVPTMYTAPTSESYHNVVNEITGAIPNVIINCPSWQLREYYPAATEVDDHIAKKSRYERDPLRFMLPMPNAQKENELEKE